MPGRLRQAAVRSAETTPQPKAYNISGLAFNEPLAWRAGKAISVADLLSRLKDLATELRTLEQGQIPAHEFTKLAQDLSHSNLLGHKDKGVRACTLCCIVDILNICAPDAPFNPAQLKDIFTVVVNTILPALADPSHAYNTQNVYILNSLVDTKSIVLITDLRDSETLIISLFTICFDIVSGAAYNASGVELAKSIEFKIRSMLVTIIDEVNLPQEATDTILSQFLRVDPRVAPEPNTKKKNEKDKKQDTLHLKDYPPAYNMAKSICTTCPDKMTVHVTQYFGNIIMNASAALEEDSKAKHGGRRHIDADDSEEGDDSLTDLKKAHRLVRELWRACPDMLQNVVPQIESELSADSTALRSLATETLGDMIAGIGISGLPPHSGLDPACFPLPSVEDSAPVSTATNPLLVPASPKPFGSVYSSAFQAFLGRRIDKSPSVRSAWIIAIGRILLTDAGGIGISPEDRISMLSGYSQMLQDIDDKVRFSAIETMSLFDYHGVIKILGSDYGLSVPGTVFSNLADRVSDRKPHVRELAMLTLGRIWGVASHDIEKNIEEVVMVLGNIPSRLFNAMYVNDVFTHLLLDRVIFENLIPLSFPPTKAKGEGSSKRGKNSQPQDLSASDVEHVRVCRILTLVRSLDTRAKQIFLGIQKRQADMSKAMRVFLKACEDYNGGVVDDENEERNLKDALSRYIQQLSKQFPDPARASSDLWKFAKMHDRRNYQLIRFAMGPEYDYKTMTKAIKELVKRIREGPSSSQALLETLLPIVYRCALILYNRSHIPAIMDISRSDELGLSETAQEMLKDISARNPEVLKSQIQALCKELQDNAPSSSKEESLSAPDTIKACAGFAIKYPTEVPKDRKFITAMIDYATNSRSYKAAKHAVTIVMMVSDKKEFHAKEIMSKATKNCQPNTPQYLARLAAISQVCLHAPAAVAGEEDTILKITVTDCLHKNQAPDQGNESSAWETPPKTETIAKQLALKIMVNRCRSAGERENPENFDTLAKSVLATLMRLIQENGEISTSVDTAPAQRNQLRLTAAQLILKLCSHKKRCEELVTPEMFTAVALVVINPPSPVRVGFVHQLRKYLVRNLLHQRWFTAFFLLAFEPDHKLKNDTVNWLKSRVQLFARHQHQSSDNKVATQTVMESIFARLLSLLAHHPDYPDAVTGDFDGELLDFARYIVFYLQAVATEENLSLIFHIAQRVKQTKDNVTGSDEISKRIYVLSDLSQAIIRNYADQMPAHAKGINLLQTYPGRVTLPSTLFAALPSSNIAREIVAKNYLPEDVALGLEKLVRSMLKGPKSEKTRRPVPDRKRKSSMSVDVDNDHEDEINRSVKKSRKTSLPIRKTPKTKRKSHDTTMTSEQPSRKSKRVSAGGGINYAESDEDDEVTEVQTSSPSRSAKSTMRNPATSTIVEQSDEDALNPEDKSSERSNVNGDESAGSDTDKHEDTEPKTSSSNAQSRSFKKRLKAAPKSTSAKTSSAKTAIAKSAAIENKGTNPNTTDNTPSRRSTRNAKHRS